MPEHLPAPSAAAGAARAIDMQALAAVLRRLARSSAAPWLHGEVARRMAERLSIVKLQPAQVVDWWAFLGHGSSLLTERYPRARHSIVEPTAALRERSSAAARLPWYATRRWTAGTPQVLDGEEAPAGSAQLVWANMMLHAQRDPLGLMQRWHAALAVGGFVMFSSFGPDTLKELRALYQRLGWPSPGAPFVDMHDLGDMLLHAGFADPVMDQEQIVLSWASPQAFLAELRTLGGNLAPDRTQGLRTPRWKMRLMQELERMGGADGRIAVHFEIVYGHAFKAAPRQRKAEQTTVSVEALRATARSRR
jgi:malonyl-CoA O-methyltransferase